MESAQGCWADPQRVDLAHDEEISDALQDARAEMPELIFRREEMSQSCRRGSRAEGCAHVAGAERLMHLTFGDLEEG